MLFCFSQADCSPNLTESRSKIASLDYFISLTLCLRHYEIIRVALSGIQSHLIIAWAICAHVTLEE